MSGESQKTNDQSWVEGRSGLQPSPSSDPHAHEQGRLVREREAQEQYNKTWGQK